MQCSFDFEVLPNDSSHFFHNKGQHLVLLGTKVSAYDKSQTTTKSSRGDGLPPSHPHIGLPLLFFLVRFDAMA